MTLSTTVNNTRHSA